MSNISNIWEVPSEYGEIDFSFNLDRVPVSDIVQLISSNFWTGYLILELNTKKAQIYFDQGVLISCQLGYLRGPTSFYCLLHWKRGRGVFCKLQRQIEPEFVGDSLAYLLEGTRLIDEWERIKQLPIIKNKLPESCKCEERFFS